MKKWQLCGLLTLAFLLVGCQKNEPPNSKAEQTKTNTQEVIPAAKGPDLQRNFYEIFVGSFYDSNNDGTGDLNGIAEKLDYLNTGDPESKEDLKVDGLWLTPVMPSPSYHKYDVTDYYQIDPQFGTLTDFENLIKKADQRGIATLMDLVINHTSSEHPWFQKALKSFTQEATAEDKKYRDWYVFKETDEAGFTPVDGAKGWAYESRFWSGMPDLNLENPEVRNEITKICQFWIDKGVAGFRLDATSHYYEGDVAKNTEFLSWLMTTLRKQKEDIYVVGEAWEDETTVTEMYASGINSLFDFEFSQANGDSDIAVAVKYGSGQQLAEEIYNYNAAIKKDNDQALDAPFLSNHDNTRSADSFTTLPEKKMAASTYLLLPGNPFIYYGEEIGLTGVGIDEDKRLPLPFTQDKKGRPAPPEAATHEATTDGGTVEKQLTDEQSLLRWYQQILRIKETYPVIGSGDFTYYESDDEELCILSYQKGEKELLVIHNYHQENDLTWNLPAALKDGQVLETMTVDGDSAANVHDDKLTLPKYSTTIFQK